jgi:tRNA(fMet)-specific endonuclease VapC
VTCHPVLCELHAGIQQTRNPAKTHAELNQLLKRVRVWPLELASCQIYGVVFNELARAGRVLSQVDMMLASLARQHSLTLLTTDLDFTALPDIRTENWTL